MGSGYIQLLAVGSEINIFNYNPNISFFKIYYRRHTNFYINNMEINANNIKATDIMNLDVNNIISINIPKNGDLLGKSYLELTLNDHYFELFKFNDELCSTLNIILLNTYDCYYIKKNNYSIEDITNISIIKINYYTNDVSSNPILSVVSSNILNEQILINLLKSQPNITLQTDQLNIFYNIDLNTLFYSFDINLYNSNIISNNLLNYFIDTIPYSKLSYIQIDFKKINISIRISYTINKYYNMLISLIMTPLFINEINEIKFDVNYVYYSVNFSLELYNLLLELFYINVEIFELEIINNKYKSTKNTFTDKIYNKITSMILNKNIDTTVYLAILNGNDVSYSVLTIMEKIIFFGNLTNEYYNELLIQNSNTVLDLFNLNNSKLSINLLIKIYISLICYNQQTSIENYLKIVNENKLLNSIDIMLKYTSNIVEFNDKLIYYLMDPNTLIVSLKSFFIILYSKNIYENLQTITYAQPFTNNHLSYYTSIINTFYINYNLIKTMTLNYNNITDDYNYLVSQLLYSNNLINTPLDSATVKNIYTSNYINNNNLFDIVKNDNLNTLLLMNNLNIIKNGIMNNGLFVLITNSILLLNYITEINYLSLYTTNGKLSNIFINSNLSQNILPFSSYIYIYSNNQKSICINDITNNDLLYNVSKDKYTNNIKINLNNIVKKYLNDYKININTNDSNILVNDFLIKSTFNEIISQYYYQTDNFIKSINMKYINIYMDEIKNINYNVIYSYYSLQNINLNNKMMYELFLYVDRNIFNNSFFNYIFDKQDKCNTALYSTNFLIEQIYNNFLFSINSPLYRIYFYFTLISKITIDLTSLNITIDKDLSTLRDLTLSFLLNFFKVFNNLQLTNDEIISVEKYNLQRTNSSIYSIQNNFICYDNINIFDDLKFKEIIKNNVSNKYIYIYNSFYVIKKQLSKYKIDNENFLNDIPNICNEFKENYDDIIVSLFINTLIDNKQYFINFDNILNLTTIFFNKNDFNYNNIIDQLNTYISEINTFSEFSKSDFYFNCCYTSFYIGNVFDNINKNNIKTINDSINFTTKYYNEYGSLNYKYCFKEFNPKQNTNYLDISTNITDVLEYFQNNLYNVFTFKYFIDINYFKIYINFMSSYVDINIVYLILYLISDYDFYISIFVIDKYLKTFNDVNGSNISLQKDNNENYEKYNFIVILYYYIYFIYKCLYIDINEYNKYILTVNNLNNDFLISFDKFIVGKYSINIYVNCIQDLIKIYSNKQVNINLDFSSFYIYVTNNEIVINNNTQNVNYNLNKKNVFTNILTNNQEISTMYDNLNYTPINYYSSYYLNNFENNTNKIYINNVFNSLYCETTLNIIDKTNLIFYINDTNIISTNIIDNNNSLNLNYIEQKKYNYDDSIYKLTTIFINLTKSFSSYGSTNNHYINRIIDYIFYNLKKFYFEKKYNYFNTLYYQAYNEIEITTNQKINNDEILTSYNNIVELSNNIDIYMLFSKYVNNLISNSLIYENSINKIIYILSTDFLINNSYDKNETRKIISNLTLYDVIKLYIGLNNKKQSNNNKQYLNNTSIYSNQSIFQIYNYENWFNNISFTQNYWINQIISNIEIDYNFSNSYYKMFIKFIDYIKFYELKIFNLLLDDKTQIIEYFQNIDNYDELLNYIFNYICLNESYSPNLIFINIVELSKSNTISSKLSIQKDHLKKKIIIFLFFSWLILYLTPSLLINNFEINKNIIMEYTLNENIKKDVSLLNVLNYQNNIEILNWSIYEIFNMDTTIDNKNMEITNYPDFIQNNTDIIYIVKQTKKVCSPIISFNILSNKYIDTYYNVIGESDIYTDNLLINNMFKPTISNLISDINVIFNNDINHNNAQNFDLTFYSLKLLGIKFNSLIYDLSNTTQNKLINTSDFTIDTKNKYTKTIVNDYNLLYNLSCLLLNNYSITYLNLSNDFNSTLNNLRTGTNNLNELLEIFKGYVSNYILSLELTPYQNFDKYNYFSSKLFNIQKLNKLVSDNNKNLSLISPNDYDVLPITINYDYLYKNFYIKYYLYNFNYNNFYNNFTVIYKKLYEYYLGIENNSNAIANIKKSSSNLYIWLFVNLISSYISNTYYNLTIQKPNNYIHIINKIIKLYFTYNYTFRINSNIPDLINLKIQKLYSNVPMFKNYIEIKNYIISYYNYQLFSTETLGTIDFKYDVIDFFNILNMDYNYNFEYFKNYLNCIFKFETILRFVYYKINTIYCLKLEINNDVIYEINDILINYITNYINVEYYFNLKIVSNLTNSKTMQLNDKIYYIINNIIDKKKFINKFSQSVKQLVYWINNNTYNKNINDVWSVNFSNISFKYHVLINNQYTIKEFTLDILNFNYLIENYIYHIFSINNDFYSDIQNVFIKIYELAFGNIDVNNNYSIINSNIINNILSLEYNEKLSENNFESSFFIDIKNSQNNYNFTDCVDGIFKIILNNNWGIIDYNIINNVPNEKLRSYITFFNLYYSYMNWLVINEKNYNNIQQYDFEYNFNIFNELYILYWIIINVYVLEYINNNTYYDLEQQIMTNSHYYINYGLKINTLDINSNFAVYMDCINSNIINHNSISNYYKNIQNDTINDSIKYKLNTFDNNKNNYDGYIGQIYNNQINKLTFNDENTISSNTFYNIIINTLGNLTSYVDIYLLDITKIIKKINDTIFNNIYTQFSILLDNFGGQDNNNICVNDSSFNKIFDENNYKQENSQITIFSLIYNQLNNHDLYSNVPIILFYYSCFITWSTLGINIQYDLKYVSNLFYDLSNIINTQILLFIENTNSNVIYNNSFFRGLDILLFNNYNNYEFIQATISYFNKLIGDKFDFVSNKTINNLLGINNSLFNGNYDKNNLINKINADIFNNIEEIKIKNNKIINWKNLLGLVADFNSSKLIYYIKSIYNVFNDNQLQQKLIDYIIKLNNSLINEYGIIKLIDRMELLFDDEIIAQYYNYNYKIFIDNFQNLNKQGLLNEMLGLKKINNTNIVSGLKPYIKFSYKQTYIIPIKFFFENYFNSIPLISCMNTNIKILTYLANINIYKNSYNINLLTPLNIETKLNADFILIEKNERIKLCSNKIDNLIQRNNFYQINKNISDIVDYNLGKNVLNINFDIELNNLVKEIIWSFDMTIDNYEFCILKNINLMKIFLENKQNITLNDFTINTKYDFIINTKFYLNGIRRDGINFLDSNTSPDYNKITTTLNPYKYNTKVELEKKYNTYSFALEPTDFQPTGAINMSNYKTFRIQVQIDKIKLMKYLNNINTLFNLKDVNFKMFLTTYEYNIVRYQSSLAGILFIS